MKRLAICSSFAIVVLAVAQTMCLGQSVVVRRVPKVSFPAHTDCNSPCHWDGNKLYVFNSASLPRRSFGPDLFHFGSTIKPEIDTTAKGGRWIECTWRNDDGVLYGWYHHEPSGICLGTDLTAPKIGALRSTDNGATWHDLGFILEAPPNTINCGAKNDYFAGGNGDFSCMLSKDKKYMYFYISAYAGDISEQGIAMARMAWSDRDNPIGKVFKYCKGKWNEPGIGGHLTPLFQARVNWMENDVDAMWGPSIHWNTYLERYVILMNHALGSPNWKPDGVFISYAKDLADPKSWTEPYKIQTVSGMYCQVIGVNTAAKETDKLCGRQARFYIAGSSVREIVFLREGGDPANLPPVYVSETAESHE